MTSLIERIAPARLSSSFRWLLSASWLSNLGDGIMIAAGPLLIASMTSAPILVASGAIMQFLPWLLFGLFAGAIADRVDRRRLVLFANGIRVVILGALLTTIATGVVNIWIVLAVAFLFGTAEVFADVGSSTFVPMFVKTQDLALANSRLQAGFIVMNQFAGPPIGALLFSIGSVWPFGVQVVCVAAATVLVSRIAHTPIPARETDKPTSIRNDVVAGVQWLWQNPPVRTLVLVILTFNVTWAAPWGVLVLYVRDYLALGEVGYGFLTAAGAVGGLIAVAIFGTLQKRFSFTTLMRACLLAEVLMHLTFALTTVGWVAYVIMGFFGLYAFIWGAVSTTVRQRLVPPHLQGRIASVNMVGVFAGLVIGQALGGVIAQLWGPTAPWWFAFVGSAITLVIVWRSLRHIVAAPPVAQSDAEADFDAEAQPDADKPQSNEP